MNDANAAAVAHLRRPATIRERCGQVFAAGQAGTLGHFTLDLDQMPRVVDYVRDVTLAAYPTLDIPFHSRWRHFAAGAIDRWASLDPIERARLRFDLAVTSVLLDAGAGAAWKYREAATGRDFVRSEGLAVASFDAFCAGLFSARRGEPHRADAAGLMDISGAQLATAFQVTDDNPLTGLDGRAALLRALGEALLRRPEMFGAEARIGNLVDYLLGQCAGQPLRADQILAAVLEAFETIWPPRLALGGIPLGDVGRHPAARASGPSDGLVPFHKLSQWLTYSLIEPLEDAGIKVVSVDDLTGLPEYRNGGLFIDLGVLRPKFDTARVAFDPLSEPIVEWRALTVTLLDRVAEGLRQQLGLNATQLPVAKVLQGGTWTAGRKIAAEKRRGGAPPIDVSSDGTLF
jgi:hypothetical protein